MSSRRKLQTVAAVSMLSLICLVGFQNCASGFEVAGTGVALSSVANGNGLDGGTEVSSAASVTTKPQTIGDATTAKTLTFDLGTSVASGYTQDGVKVSVSVMKFSPSSGSGDVYYISKPTLMNGAHAMQVRSVSVVVNGVKNESATTFQSISAVIAASQTQQLSAATLLHPIASLSANPSDTLALEFDTLWPDGVPLPTGTVTPISGLSLYNTNCANCHGALGVSAKKGRTYDQIQASFTSVSQMTYLAGTLSQAEVQAIADALK